MNVQITDVGLAALNANAGVITLSLCKIGDGYNYVPSPTDTDIHGNLVFSGVPSAPVAANANVVKYGFYMDYSVGDFAYGEFGLFMENGDLFALGCSSSLYEKLKLTSATTGNSVRIDIYLSVNNQNYDMWFDIGESNNQFRIAVLQSPDLLPQSKDATPNAYVVQGATPDQNAMLAFTDRNGIWSFDAYQFINQVGGTITGFDSQSVTIDLSTYTSDMTPSYFGQVIFEFTSGTDYSICRYVSSTVESNGVMRLNFATPLLKTPQVGDSFVIFKRNPLSSSNVQIPIASDTVLGGIKLSNDFDITSDGVLSLDPLGVGWVLSVNSMTGDVELTADDIPGISTVGKTGKYSDLIDAPDAYVLPTASQTTLGGIKIPSNGNLTVGSGGVLDLGFTPVKTVNGVQPDANGNVDPPADVGLTDPQPIPPGSNLQTFQTAGLFYTDANTGAVTNAPGGLTSFILEVIPFTEEGTGGDVIQRVTAANICYLSKCTSGSWSSWTQIGGSPPLATTSFPGVMQVGSGLGVTPAGVVSALFKTVNGKSYDPSTGNVQLSASDVGALDAQNVGTPGNIPGFLTDQSGTPTDPDWYFQNGRLPAKQLPIASYYRVGLWNANTGAVSVNQDRWSINSLVAGGLINVTVEGPAGTFNTFDANAEGMIFVVNVAGNTTLDGNTAWQVGDRLQALSGAWVKVGSGSPGALAGPLTRGSGAATDNDYFFNNGRLPGSQLPINSMYICGTLNGATGAIVGVVRGDYNYKSLAANGNIVITITNAAGVSNDVTVNARGRIFQVQDTGGNFAIDGITQWVVGDQAISLNGQWRRWSSTAVRSVQGIIADSNGNVNLTRAAISNALGGALEGRTTAGGTSGLSIYATGGQPLFLNRDGGNTVYFGNGAGANVAYVDASGNGVFTNATALSDIREKENIKPVSRALYKLMRLKYFTYNLIGQPDVRLLSTSAQDLQEVQPETVMERADGKLGVYTEGHVALVGAALQEAYHRIIALEEGLRRAYAKINRLEKENGNDN